MEPEQQKEIFEKCPILYRNRGLKCRQIIMNFGFECGPGWFDLILELSIAIEAIAQRMKADGVDESCLPYAMQVKEKFGRLRVYVANECREIADLIDSAVLGSGEICEICGKPGSPKLKDGWRITACDECIQNY